MTKPALLLLPGVDGLAAPFSTQLAALEERWDVRVVDYGDPAEPATHQGHVELAQARLAPEPTIVLGLSFGGSVALELALAQPQRVAALVLVNSFSCLGTVRRLGCRLAPYVPVGLLRRLRPLGIGLRLFGPATPRPARDAFVRASEPTQLRSMVRRLRLLADWSARERLPELQVPLLLIAADGDRVVPSGAEAARIAAAVPGARSHVLRGSGHLPLFDPGVSLAELLAELPEKA